MPGNFRGAIRDGCFCCIKHPPFLPHNNLGRKRGSASGRHFLLWSVPDTRLKLLQGLAEKGFGHDQLAEMQKVIDAEKSDLFDVLAHVAYAVPPLTREVRAAHARVYINSQFTTKQQAFLDFVLSHYVTEGVEELDPAKLTPLPRLRYHDSIADALADLGKPEEIGRVFEGFQKYLYQPGGL